MNKRTSNILLFLVGLFTWTRVNVIGMIGLAELPCLFLAPILFFQDLPQLRRDGVSKLCWLWLATCAGCIFSSLYNHCAFTQWIRGLATPLVSFAMLVVIYHLMKNNPDGIRWLFLGWALTGIFTMIVHGGSVATLMDDGSADNPQASITLMYLFVPIVLIPVRCWYSKTPTLVSVGTLVAYGLYIARATESGRSTALIILACAGLVFFGGKSARRMAKIRKNFWMFIMVAIGMVFVAKAIYSHAATSGLMGEKARLKYESQTRGDDSLLRLLMGGRIQFFAGAYAGCKNPLVGYGPWPIDWDHVYERFLKKYGDYEDFKSYCDTLDKRGGMGEIPSHSHIIGFWTWYGIAGLILWVYVLYLIVQYFRKYVDVVPQWYGIFASSIPMLLWNIFFSPYADRTQTGAIMCALLMVRAMATGRRRMPLEMQRERMGYLK